MRGYGGLRMTPARAVVCAVIVAAGLGVAAPRAGAQTTAVKAFMTLYGYEDNSPPGTVISHPCIHARAGGAGTYANPITFATDTAELPYCQIVYVPYMQRYFIHEDECSQCDQNWNAGHRYRFDMWAGGDASSRRQPERKALARCESAWTRANSANDPDNPTVEIDPPPNLPVTPAPIFSPPTGCWSGGPFVVANPGKQTSRTGSPVTLHISAHDYAASPIPRYAASGLPGGLSINATTGVISGTPTTRGRTTVAVVVSDPTGSASVSFVWNVRRG